MSQQGYLAQPKAPHRAIKPAVVTLLLAGSAVLYTAWQPEPSGKPEPATGSGNDAKAAHEAAGNPAPAQHGDIAVAPDFGKAVAEPAPDAGVAATLASAVSSAVETVQASAIGAKRAPAGESPPQAVTRIVLPDPAPLPAATVRVALPEPAPAATTPQHAEPGSPGPVSGPAPHSDLAPPEAAPVPSGLAAGSPGTPEAGQPPHAAPEQQPVPQADPMQAAAPATAVAPAVVPPMSDSVPTPAEESGAMRAFGDTRYVPLSEAGLDSMRPIGAPALTHVSVDTVTPAAKALPEAGLAPVRAVPASPAARGDAIGHPLSVHLAPGGEPSLRLKELVGVFARQLDPRLVEAVEASPALDALVSFERLRAAGIDIRHDAARDRVILAAVRA